MNFIDNNDVFALIFEYLEPYFQKKKQKIPENEACKREARLLVFTVIAPVQHQHLSAKSLH